VLNDYRAILRGIFARLYGLEPEQVLRVFPQSRAVELGLL
jgi:hypothetical protein